MKLQNVLKYLKQCDVVFPVFHGPNGEDGKLQGMFDIKFVGCKTLSIVIGMDKKMFKIVFHSLDIPQVPYLVIEENIK